MTRTPRHIDLKRLTELWLREPRLTLGEIAAELSTPQRTLSTQSVFSYVHRYGLPKRKTYNRRASGSSPRFRRDSHRKGMLPIDQLLRRCPECRAQYRDVDNHVCPDPRIVRRMQMTYCR